MEVYWREREQEKGTGSDVGDSVEPFMIFCDSVPVPFSCGAIGFGKNLCGSLLFAAQREWSVIKRGQALSGSGL